MTYNTAGGGLSVRSVTYRCDCGNGIRETPGRGETVRQMLPRVMATAWLWNPRGRAWRQLLIAREMQVDNSARTTYILPYAESTQHSRSSRPCRAARATRARMLGALRIRQNVRRSGRVVYLHFPCDEQLPPRATARIP